MHSKVSEFVRILYGKTVDPENLDKNHVLGPISIYTSLSLLTLGAQDTSLDELLSLMQINSIEELTNNMSEYFRNLQANKGDCVLSSSSAIYSKETLKPEYQNACLKFFNSKAVHAPDLQTNIEKWAEEMNNFICESTNGKIQHMIEADSLKDASVFLINAMHFKAAWKDSFDGSCPHLNFNLMNGSNVEVPYLTGSKSVYYAEFPELKLKVIKKELLNCPFYVMLLLPEEVTGLKNLIKDLFTNQENAKKNFDEVFLNNMTYQNVNVDLMIPKFKLESSIALVDSLRSLGVNQIFTLNARLSGITNEDHMVSNIMHKATFELNEEGVEASAATVIKCIPLCARINKYKFRADHPFLAAITTNQGVPLFIGHVENPTKS